MERTVAKSYINNIISWLKDIQSNEYYKQFGYKELRECEDSVIEIDRYVEILKKSPAYYPVAEGQTYTRLFEFEDGRSKYEIEWQISMAVNYAKKNLDSLQVGLIRLKNIIDSVDTTWINRSREEYALKNNAPIILANYDPLNKLIIIDGNHRVYAQFKNNPNGAINAILFKPEEHLLFMCGSVHRLLYKIHHNVVVFTNYKLGLIEKYEYKENSDATSLYII